MDLLTYLSGGGGRSHPTPVAKVCLNDLLIAQSKNAGQNPVWNLMQLPTIMTMAIAMGFELSNYIKKL